MENREKIKNKFVLILFLTFAIVLFADFVVAANCWEYTSSSTCTTANGCNWRNDSWSTTGWCEELNCWSFYTQSGCSSAVVPGKNCTWHAGTTNSYCNRITCWNYAGTNQTSCESNPLNLNCQWNQRCYSDTWTPGINCYNLANQSACQNSSGCKWGECNERGCWNYNLASTCNAAKDPWNGKNCTWTTYSGSSYCESNGCWKYWQNESYCLNSSAATELDCEWKWNTCNEKNCWSFDYTNETACVNNTLNKSCTWSGSWCMQKDCWNYNDQASCLNQNNTCTWKTFYNPGWCQEIGCWNWDTINSGNESACALYAGIYGLNCIWQNSTWDENQGWCYQNMNVVSCANKTTERDCLDTFYCWWQYYNWSNISAGGNCKEPSNFSLTTNISIFTEWNPGCYIFDMNSSDCNSVLGCNFDEICRYSNHSNNKTIEKQGINCSMINSSQLCNNIPILSTCCSWNSTTCNENRLSTICKDQLEQKAEDSCEDAETNTRCRQIAGSPWYMPCIWDNSTSKCNFKIISVFGNETPNIMLIDNKFSCQSAGGKWIVESYCEGNVSIPTGRCEYKFNEEDNCDKACFACELKTSDGVVVNSTNAASACMGSNLGMCEFTADTNAPNRIGYCNAKEQFKKGLAGNCDTLCGDCTFKGDPNNNDTEKKPSYYCQYSKANSIGGGCKWIVDNSTIKGGYCVNKGDKTCEDSCDRCKTQTKCQNIGRTAIANQSGSCKWEGEATSGSCISNSGGEVEICWDGVDNNNNGLTDCTDLSCYSDSSCGFVEGDCFGWTTNTTCINHDCEWITDKWGSWCDFKGSQCWKFNFGETECSGLTQINETLNITTARLAKNNINPTIPLKLANLGTGWMNGTIVITTRNGSVLAGNYTGGPQTAGNYTIDFTAQTIRFFNTTVMVDLITTNANLTNISYRYYSRAQNCQWNNGTGNGWCERDMSKAEICMGLTRTACATANASGCNWSVDTWCAGNGNQSDWCINYGGWCDHVDFAPKNCWMYIGSSAQCNNRTGCNWHADTYSTSMCEINWSANCWQYTASSTCNTQSNYCRWKNDSWGGWCEFKTNVCYEQYNQTSCQSQSLCSWKTSAWGSWCEPVCYSANQSVCTSKIPTCNWKFENGWCEERGCWNYEQTECSNQTGIDAGCRWKNPGWCDPKNMGFSATATATGGGIGTAIGADCYKYDGNRTLCTNKTIINISCGWTINTNPSCDVDWSRECWKYTSVDNGCTSGNGCWWNPGYGTGGTGWCSNLMDQCWSNQSYQSWNNTAWRENCTLNPLCMNNSWGCEPKCSSLTTQNICINATYINKCRWNEGWCNPATMNEMFTDMEAGAPTPLGKDTCGEGIQASVDICEFGIKDMKDSYGFGAGVYDISNASICNKEKISSFVSGIIDSQSGSGGGVGVVGGVITTAFGMEKTGNGNETVIYLVYLDTDGATTGGCALTHNSSAVGYEFRFKYSSEWSSNTSKAVESFNAYICDNSQWKAADIKLSAWKKSMCSEMGGIMCAVKKADLIKYPLLYDSTKDMRVAIATIGNAGTGNISSPTDSAGPAWTTPGSIDFEIINAFSYGADTAKFEDILKNGFVKYEDCFNSIDDDGDGFIDCNDWNCQDSSKCTLLGVNAPGYNDTKVPQVIGVKIEEYPDSALIMYDTNKPTNGTLLLYNYGDTTCLNQSYEIMDIGLLSADVKDYKLWHTSLIYDAGNTAISLNWPLANGSSYNYKLKVCDSANKCSISRCTSLKTAGSISQCGYCNFIARIKAPSAWTVKYDVDRNGVYEHTQGEVCGPNAGMKINYTSGRKVNIKLEKSDGTTYIEFINASLTKTGLNDKVRTISTSGDIIYNSATGIVGLTAETRDKIINNLHPEICRMKIPTTGGGCTNLYHCDDSGENCTDRTTAAGGAPINATSCLWNIPYCEFSTYKTTAASGTTSSSGGGGGGGSSVTTAQSFSITTGQVTVGYTKELANKESITFDIGGGKWHAVKLTNITATSATVEISSTPQKITLSVGEERKVDLDGDTAYDLSVKLNKVDVVKNTAELTVKKISSTSAGTSGITGEAIVSEETGGAAEVEGKQKETGLLIGVAAGIIILIIIIAGVLISLKLLKKK